MGEIQSISNYMNLYEYGKDRLVKAKIRDAEIDARYLLLYVYEIDMNQFLMDYVKEFDERQTALIERYKDALNKRANHIPLQYLTHEQNFCGIDFYVDEHVLIPRQDTEVLIEKILKDHPKSDNHIRLLDMCTGSGCIAITLKMLGGYNEVYASDISVDALKVADKNAQLQGIDMPFFESDMWDSLTSLSNLDIIVCNPPYIRSEVVDILDSEVKDHEPRLALDGDKDGLSFYRRLISEAPNHLRDNGMIYMEIGYDQADDVSTMLTEAGFEDIEVIKDLAGLDRVVCGSKR